MAYLRLVVSPEVFFFKENPCEGRRIATPAVEIGANHLANPAPRAERSVRQNDPLSQGNLLPVGKGEDSQDITESNDASEPENANG